MATPWPALYLLGLYDELWSGVAVVGAPAVEETHALGHASYTLWVFALSLLLSALIEAPLALCADRLGRRRVLIAGELVLSAALCLGAFASTPWLLALALALAGAASGAACGAAHGELIARSPLGGARAMSRWAAFAALGDALVPFLVAGLSWLGSGYRTALLWVAIPIGAQAVLALVRSGQVEPSLHAEAESEEEAAPAPFRDALRALLRARRLGWFLLASSLCCLLDEVVVALAALRFRLDQGASLSMTALGSMLIALGSLVGALLTERLLQRVSARRILVASSLLCIAALGWLCAIQSLALSLVLLTVIGLGAAPHHALMQAAAYEQVPGSPGLVNAALQPFVLLEVGLPLIVGLIATELGLGAALLTLSVQPIAVLLVARALMPRGARSGHSV